MKRRRRSRQIVRRLAFAAASGGAVAIGAFSIGAMAVGAGAIGVLTIGRLAARKVRIDDVRINRLQVAELSVADRPAGIIPYLCVIDAKKALEFYSEAFGLSVIGEPRIFDGKIGHAELGSGTFRMFIADEFPNFGVRSPLWVGSCTATMVLPVPDVDAAVDRARRAGATVTQEPVDEPYGRTAKLQDPSGHRWILNSR